jgi:hypothetical protein
MNWEKFWKEFEETGTNIWITRYKLPKSDTFLGELVKNLIQTRWWRFRKRAKLLNDIVTILALDKFEVEE